MAVFYSFHYANDNWRVHQVRNIGIVDNRGTVASQDWEKVRYNSNGFIKEWIDSQMSYKRAVVVLIGSETASRSWVQYEIKRAWDLKKPLLGIRIHGLKDSDGLTDSQGQDPFMIIEDHKDYYQRIPIFDPTQTDRFGNIDSSATYAELSDKLASWVTQGRVNK